MLPQGYHRVVEQSSVSTQVVPNALVKIFGDEHFEQADRASCASNHTSNPQFWKGLPSLESVHVGAGSPNEAVSVLKDLPCLKELSFYNAELTDSELGDLGTLPSLTKLDLRGCRITDAFFERLDRLPQLQSLSVGGPDPQLKGVGLSNLKKASHLKSLNLAQANISDSEMKNLRDIHQLEILNLRLCRIDEGLEHLVGLSNLVELNLDGTLVTDNSLRHLFGLKSLREIDLTGTLITESGGKQLQKHLPDAHLKTGVIVEESRRLARTFQKLRVPIYRDGMDSIWFLDFRSSKHFNETFQSVLELKGLKELRVGSEATDETLHRLVEIPSLETLFLNNAQISSEGLASLQRCPSLKHLYLVRMNLPVSAFETLGEFEKLEGLSLIETNVTDADLAFLKTLPQLKQLYLDRTGVTETCIPQLDGLNHLERLSLKGTKIDPESMMVFIQNHPTCKIVFN